MTNLVKTGTLSANATPVVVAVGDMNAPMTATLTSSAGASRLIEVSSDGGNNFYSPALSNSTAAMVNLAIMSPVSHVRFTGNAGDVWRVQ